MKSNLFAKTSSSYKFLIISDLHMNHKKLEKLKSWYFAYDNNKIDYLLILGDFDNLKSPTPISEISESESRISNILSFVEFFGCPILYIPGNHDPSSLFQIDVQTNPLEIKKLTQHSINLHNSKLEIDRDLQIVGFGGSVPIYSRDKEGKNTEIFGGYPFDSEIQCEEALNQVKSFFNKEMKTIFITHNGPEGSSTCLGLRDKNFEPLYFGSQSLTNIILEKKNNIFLNIHGHCHDGVGKVAFGDADVVNPGALTQGKFCKIEIIKNVTENKWGVAKSEFIDLDYY